MKVDAEHYQVADALVLKWVEKTGKMGDLVDAIAEALQTAYNDGARSVVVYDARQHLSELVNILIEARGEDERVLVLRSFRERMIKEMSGGR